MKSVSRRTVTLLAGVTAAAVAVAIVASGATARSTQTGRVCVLLPDTVSSVRWEQFDKPGFIKAFKKAGIPATVAPSRLSLTRSSRSNSASGSITVPRFRMRDIACFSYGLKFDKFKQYEPAPNLSAYLQQHGSIAIFKTLSLSVHYNFNLGK